MTIHATNPPTVVGTEGIRVLRRYCGYSQGTLASMLGVSKGTIERLEQGERQGTTLPSNYRVYVLATERIKELYTQVHR